MTAGGGEEVPESGSVTNNNDGSDIVTAPPSGGGGSVVVQVNAISVDDVAEVDPQAHFGVELSTTVLPSGAVGNVNYQWERQEGGTGDWVAIDGATSSTYTIAAPVEVGDNVRVTATGTGNYTGTVTSDAVEVVALIQYASTEVVDFDVTVPLGTEEAAAIAELAETVGVVGSDSETADATIAWTIDGYDGETEGDYTATGVLTLPEGWDGEPADVTATVTVIMIPIPVTGVTILEDYHEILVGETTELTAVIEPSDALDKTVTWSSDNESIATVDVNGVVTGVEEGLVLISVETNDGGHTDTVAIRVELTDEEKINKVKDMLDDSVILGVNPDLDNITQNLNLVEDGAYQSTISWSSDNTDVIATDGIVTRPVAGTENVTVELIATVTIGDASGTKTFVATVLQEEDNEIASVETLADINVAYGTGIEEIGLPTTVEVTLDDDTTATLNVTWDGGTPAYDGNTAETYVFEGTLELVAGVANTAGETATVNVTVAFDLSEFSVALDVEEDKTQDVAFNLEITGAKDTDGTDLEGDINVTVTSNTADAEVHSAAVTFTAGVATVPVTLNTLGAHELTVDVTGVTADATVAVTIEAPVEPSTYSFDFDVPDTILAGMESTIIVTFATEEVKDIGYDGVRFKFTKTSGEGEVTFEAMDSAGNLYEATDEGYWGPGDGFDIDADYTATTPWDVTFSEAGSYTFEVSLVSADDDSKIITDTVNVTVLAQDVAIIPESGNTIEVGETITVTAQGADDLRIMLWAKELTNLIDAQAAYYDDERVFSARLSTIEQVEDIDVTIGDGSFTITINQAFIDLLEKGTRYESGQPTEGQYTWTAGDTTTWLITPETDGVRWSEYETWDGAKAGDTLVNYNLDVAFIEAELWSNSEYYYIGSEVDVVVQGQLNDATLTRINDGTIDITEGETDQYTFVFNEGRGVHELTITGSYLNDKLQSKDETVTLTLYFDESADNAHTLTLTIIALDPDTYHVSTSGDDTNDGSDSSPFLTINHALSLATVGDTIKIGTGTFEESITIAKELDFLTITGEAGTIINGDITIEHILDEPQEWPSNVTLEDFEVTGSLYIAPQMIIDNLTIGTNLIGEAGGSTITNTTVLGDFQAGGSETNIDGLDVTGDAYFKGPHMAVMNSTFGGAVYGAAFDDFEILSAEATELIRGSDAPQDAYITVAIPQTSGEFVAEMIAGQIIRINLNGVALNSSADWSVVGLEEKLDLRVTGSEIELEVKTGQTLAAGTVIVIQAVNGVEMTQDWDQVNVTLERINPGTPWWNYQFHLQTTYPLAASPVPD